MEQGKRKVKPWHKRWWGFLLIIGFWPITLIWWVWKKSNWEREIKIASTIVLVILIFIVGVRYGQNVEKTKRLTTEALNQRQVDSSISLTVTLAPKMKRVPYEIINTWEIPNGGQGKLVVIDTKYFNKEGIPLLGQILKEDVKNNKNGNSGFNEFVIYYDGVMGSNSETIKY